jgi:hypothetical protein
LRNRGYSIGSDFKTFEERVKNPDKERLPKYPIRGLKGLPMHKESI